MTVETVDALAELTSPATNDEVGIWDVSAGQFKKIQVANLLGGVITGGGIIATGGFTLTVPASGTAALVANLYKPVSVVTSNNSITALSSWTPLVVCIIMIWDYNSGSVGLFMISGANVTYEMSDPASKFSVTPDTTGINVYYSSGFKIQNKTGAQCEIAVLAFGPF